MTGTSNNIYFNFISFGSIIATTFLLFVGIAILRIPNKSKATIHLAFVFLWEVIHNLAYIIAFGYYDPIAAYHRWLSIIGVMPGILHITQFFFYFPEEKNPRIALGFMIVQYSVAAFLTYLFIRKSLIVGTIFHADGQYWNINEQTLGTNIALVIILYMFVFIGVAVWRIVTDKNGQRKKIAALLFSFLVVVLVPAILNALEKSGKIPKDLFHTLWSLITVLGWFMTVIFYINLTKDRTSFMYKIVGISSVTLLVIMLAIGYFTLNDTEKAYDAIHRQAVPRILLDQDYRPPDLIYIAATDLSDKKSRFIMKKGDVSIDFFKKNVGDINLIREGKNKIAHYKSYTLYVLKTNILYEVGFSYHNYRTYVHSATMKLIIILGGMLFVVIFGFRFFFFGTLISPLKSLIGGLRKVEKGNLDVSIPIRIEDEIGFLTRNFNTMVSTIRTGKQQIDDFINNLEQKVKDRTIDLHMAMKELEVTNENLVETRDALWGEMALAKKIQTVLLPENPSISGYEVIAYMSPADEVGGDYYDVIKGKESDWLIIGDVSGHGVPAGLVMMMIQTSIQVIIRTNPNLTPSQLLRVINRGVTYNIKRLDEDKYMTISALAFHENGRVIFSGLHQDILIYRKGTGKVDIVETRGIWIGIIEEIKGMIEDDEFSMNSGDTLLLFTDGITEAWVKDSVKDIRNPLNDMFGAEKLMEIFQRLGNLSLEKIKDGILNELKSYNCVDDVTMVVMRRLK